MKYLVTGATGFIGSHLVERMVKEGKDVRVLVRGGDGYDKLDLLKGLGVDIFYGDLTDIESLKGVADDVDVVFHLAAIARPMAIPDDEYFRINERGTRNLLEECKDSKVGRIVMMSSVSAVGVSLDGKAVDEMTVCRPVDVYGWSKLAQEKIAFDFIEKFGLDVVILRPPMVFGPRDLEMLRLFKAVNFGFFPVKSNLKCLEFLYVENLVEACFVVLENGKVGEVYHVTNGKHYSINELVNSMEKSLGKKVLPFKLPKSVFVFGGYIIEGLFKIVGRYPPLSHDTVNWMTKRLWYSDDDKLKNIGFEAKVGLDEGIKKTIDYYKSKDYL